LKDKLTEYLLFYLATLPSIHAHLYPGILTQEHDKDRKFTQDTGSNTQTLFLSKPGKVVLKYVMKNGSPNHSSESQDTWHFIRDLVKKRKKGKMMKLSTVTTMCSPSYSRN
jgi:hypothetical protein